MGSSSAPDVQPLPPGLLSTPGACVSAPLLLRPPRSVVISVASSARGGPHLSTHNKPPAPLGPWFLLLFFLRTVTSFCFSRIPPLGESERILSPNNPFFFFFCQFFFFLLVRRSVVAFGTIITASARGECVQRNENVVLCKNFFFFFFLFSSEEEDHMLCRIFGLGEPSTTPTSPGDTQTHKKPASVFVVP